MNLQLFSQEKTEKATPRKRQKAREKGQVFSSKDLVAAIIIITGFVLIKVIGPYVFNNLLDLFKDIFQNYLHRDDIFDIQVIHKFLIELLILSNKLVIPLLFGLACMSIFANLLQTGLVFNTQSIFPDLNRINPLEGIKRIFSKKSIVELFKSIIKIALIAYLVYSTIKSSLELFIILIDVDLNSAVKIISDIILNFGIKTGCIVLALSVFDYAYQWHEYETSLMMTKEEIKEEYKEVEGNPQTKSRIRQIQRQLARSRMMNDVKKADVIITNPTHLAIALGYDISINPAPVVLAKGSDKIAEKIKEIAEIEHIPIVEDKPLAQTLYKSVEIGDLIPEDLYHAVAEILAFVYTLKEGGKDV